MGAAGAPSPRFEVAIVGGGPAGCATALGLLARRPALAGRIALLERRAHPREKYCGGALSAWGLDALARLGLEALAAHGTPFRALAVRVGGRVGRVEWAGAPLGRVIRRSVLDAGLFRAAAERGAVTRERCNVTALTRLPGGRGFALACGDDGAAETIEARVVVGADGAGGTTRRLLGLGEPRRRAHLYLVETDGVEARDGVREGTLLFDLDVAAVDRLEGYYWDFPAPLDGTPGTSRGVFDLNSAPRGDGDALKRALARSLAERGVALSAVTLKPHAIRPFAPGAAASVPGALLVGEAVGVDPVTGEGIAHALAYGELAAQAIDEGLARGDLAFADWSSRIAASFVGRHLRQACRLAPHVYGPRAARYARFLAGSPHAMHAGARWYRGERVDRGTQAGVLARLAGYALARSIAR